jgi:hypothetical protein
MTHTKKHSLTIKFALPLALGIALTLSSGCSKQEKTETDHSEMKMAEIPPTPAAVPAPPAIKTAAATVKPAELAPLSPQIITMITSNRTASAYDRVYGITNSTLTSVQKAQSLLLILPSFDRDGQRAAAHAAVNYVDDSAHALINQPLLEGKLDKQILSIFMTDTLKRSDAIKIPVLTSIAAMNEHPMQAEAQDLLAAFTKPHSAATQKAEAADQLQASNKMD